MPTNQAEFYRGLERAGEALQSCEAQDAARAAAVHRAVQPLLEDTEVAAQLACRRGCSHCCHYPVGVTFPEAMRLADAVLRRPELSPRVRDADAAVAKQSWEQLVGVPCPMLVDDACAIHDARPMPCRALGSLDAASCAHALTTDRAPPRDEAAWWRGLGAAHALAKAEPTGSRELRSAVSAILANADAPQDAFRSARVAPGSLPE
jgi:hypothetical protein